MRVVYLVIEYTPKKNGKGTYPRTVFHSTSVKEAQEELNRLNRIGDYTYDLAEYKSEVDIDNKELLDVIDFPQLAKVGFK